MIHSTQPERNRENFELLLHDLDKDLRESEKPNTKNDWSQIAGIAFEDEILDRLKHLASETPFQDTFVKVSGQKFPDIVAWIKDQKGFGIEAKTTKKDNWKSTGSSIVESSRVEGIERIYMSFAKLGGEKPDFRTKLYEECLSGVAVTHSPRYTIDMDLLEDETIFDKVEVPYENIRNSDDPFKPFRDHYTKGKDPSKTLWWADSSSEAAPPVLRHWSDVESEERKALRLEAFFRFPEVIQHHGKAKYTQTSLWLTSTKAIVASSLRDLFSSGKVKEDSIYPSGCILPRVLERMYKDIRREQDVLIEFLPDSFDSDQWFEALREGVKSYSSCETYPKNLMRSFDLFYEEVYPLLKG